MRYLAILLLAPWLLILGWAYWSYPRNLPHSTARRVFDTAVLLLACGGVVEAALLAFDHVRVPQAGVFGLPAGGIWQLVLPALVAYGAFTLVVVCGVVLRQVCWGGQRR